MIVFGIILAASLALATPSPAPSPDSSLEYEAGISHEALTKNYPDWDSQYLRLVEKTADHQTFYAQFEATSRFNKQDEQLTLGLYLPVGPRWQFMGEGSASNPHAILPSSSVLAGLQYASGGNWFEGIAARHTRYDVANVNSGVFSIEHYWSRYRIYYALTAAHVSNAGTDVEHAIEFDNYYGKNEHNYVGVVYVTGREVENAGLPVLLISHVNGWNIVGRHWIDEHWAMVYGLGLFAQGSSYTRTGGHVGIDYRF